MPDYDVSEFHETSVRAPIDSVYDALRTTDLSRSTIVRLLLRLRALPSSSSANDQGRNADLNLAALMKRNFILLGENSPNEIALGLIGKFWMLSSEVCQINNSDAFRKFDRAGYAEAVWNFSLVEESQVVTRLATETRVRCLDDRSRWRFRLYWSIIGPFSGLIRREILRTIRKAAESSEFRA